MSLSRATLALQLRTLGVPPTGVPLMLHASLRKLGPVEGGANGVLDAVLEVLGPEGTLVMPLGSREDDYAFDARTSPADPEMGVLAEVFRQRPGVHCNDHAAARFAALGARSVEILEPISLHDYYGPGSPLERFTDLGGWVLRLGADIDTVTLTHWSEYRADLPTKRRVRRRYVRADVGEQWVEGLDDCDGIVEWSEGDYFSRILLDFIGTGRARVGPIGGCTGELFEGSPFVAFATAWLEEHFGRDARGRSGIVVGLANEALIRKIKEIIAAGRAGTIDDAYDGYRRLFGDAEFTQSEPSDQRQALKLMILAKSPPRPATPAMVEAHRAAMGPLVHLVRTYSEPADHELLGVCHTLLGEDDAASAIFRAGLAIERERNPSSDLCGTLMKRISTA